MTEQPGPLPAALGWFFERARADPSWLRVLLWEVLDGSDDVPGGDEVDQRRRRYAERVAWVETEQAAGPAAADGLDPDLLLLSLFGAAIYPLLLPQVCRLVTGEAPDSEEFARALPPPPDPAGRGVPPSVGCGEAAHGRPSWAQSWCSARAVPATGRRPRSPTHGRRGDHGAGHDHDWPPHHGGDDDDPAGHDGATTPRSRRPPRFRPTTVPPTTTCAADRAAARARPVRRGPADHRRRAGDPRRDGRARDRLHPRRRGRRAGRRGRPHGRRRCPTASTSGWCRR